MERIIKWISELVKQYGRYTVASVWFPIRFGFPQSPPLVITIIFITIFRYPTLFDNDGIQRKYFGALLVVL